MSISIKWTYHFFFTTHGCGLCCNWRDYAKLSISWVRREYYQGWQKDKIKSDHPPLRMCLFGGEIGWIENFREKMENKTFLECVWLGGKEENKWLGLSVFSLSLLKSSLKNWEKIEGRKRGCLMDKNAYIQFISFFFFFCWACGLFLYSFFFFPFFLFWIFFFHFLIS